MGLPTNTYTTYAKASSIRESLLDALSFVEQEATPFFSTIKKHSNVGKTLHEWVVDSLRSVTDNKQLEGDDTDARSVTAPTRRSNYCQISKGVISLTGSQLASNHVGVGKKALLAHEKMKEMRVLKMEIENALVGLNNAKVAGNASTERELASYQSWVITNVSKASGGTNPTGDGTDARGDGTQRAFTEDLLQAVLSLLYTAGGNANTLHVGAFNKRQVNTFSGGATKNVDASDEKVYTNVKMYVNDITGGIINVVANPRLRTRDAILFDPSMWSCAFLRPFESTELSKTGDSERFQIVAEYTLEALNEKSSGIIADLTTS